MYPTLNALLTLFTPISHKLFSNLSLHKNELNECWSWNHYGLQEKHKLAMQKWGGAGHPTAARRNLKPGLDSWGLVSCVAGISPEWRDNAQNAQCYHQHHYLYRIGNELVPVLIPPPCMPAIEMESYVCNLHFRGNPLTPPFKMFRRSIN